MSGFAQRDKKIAGQKGLKIIVEKRWKRSNFATLLINFFEFLDYYYYQAIFINLKQVNLMIGRLMSKLRGIKNTYRQNRILGLWDAKKYDKMAAMFNKKEDYFSYKINEYPFIYFLINQKDKPAIDAFLSKVSFKSDVLNDDSNPMNVPPICFAFLEGDEEMVSIFQKNGGNLKMINSFGQNALHLAAIYRRQESFKKGVALNIDFNAPDQFGNTPFHYAARTGSYQMTNTMLSAKAKKLQNKIYQYPIHMAIQSGVYETYQLLKGDVTGVYPKYHPIHSAARSGSTEILANILKLKPACLNFKDYNGLTPLHHAITIQDPVVVRFLLNQPGILVNEPDNFGNSPLHLAFMNENLQLSSLLLDWGGNLDMINVDNLSPADYGISSKNKQLHSLLLRYGQKSKKVEEWSNFKY